MKIRLVCLRQITYDTMLQLYEQAQPKLHTLVQDDEAAEMILIVGGWGPRGEGVVDSPLCRRYPEKTFIYRDDDGFVPLLPGVYPPAERPRLFDLRRVEAQQYINSANPHIQPLAVEKKYLFSFAGGSTSLVRKRLYRMKFERPDVRIENTSDYYHWDETQPGREERQKRYAETIAGSHFCLCPRGASAGSYRLYEAMRMGVAPVVISDRQMLPKGPEWERIAISVPERRIKDLEKILEAHWGESEARGRLAREAYEQWFSTPVVFNNIVAACERIRSERRIPERWVRPFWRFMLWRVAAASALRGVAKGMVLWAFRLAGRKFLYDLNER